MSRATQEHAHAEALFGRPPQAATPCLSVAAWLLGGGDLPARVKWAIDQGFKGLALHPCWRSSPTGEREAAAAVMREAGLRVTYHSNAEGLWRTADEYDRDAVRGMLDDVVWWHERAGGVAVCCADAVHGPLAMAPPSFATGMNARFLELHAEILSPHGIRIGIENGFSARSLRGPDDFVAFVAESGIPDCGTLMDVGHAHIHLSSLPQATRPSLAEFVSSWPLEILEFHFSDNHGQRDEHLPMGEGTLQLEGFREVLQARAFTGSLTAETCLDILNGRYSLDIHRPEEIGRMLATRDAIQHYMG